MAYINILHQLAPDHQIPQVPPEQSLEVIQNKPWCASAKDFSYQLICKPVSLKQFTKDPSGLPAKPAMMKNNASSTTQG